jgi:hypothetical protein
MLYQIGDNTTANKAAEKGSARTDSHVASAICRLQCTIQQETGIGTRTGKVATADTLKHCLSQEYSVTELRTSALCYL